MDSQDPKKPSHAMPLPDEPLSGQQAAPDSQNPAADLVRQKVQAAYGNEPDIATEALDLKEVGTTNPSKHQKFIYDLTNSGMPLAKIQSAWHDYYAELPDEQKHEVWREFYGAHAQATSYSNATPVMAPQKPDVAGQNRRRTLDEARKTVFKSLPAGRKLKPAQHFQSMLFGLGVGSVVVLIFLFSFFNERFIAPFIQPSRNVTGTPIISSNAASGTDPAIIIPKINLEVPVVYGVRTVEEQAVQKALENGVVHYGNTSEPGQTGNSVIVGHSSNNILNPGKYKFAFVLLSRLENKDIFYLEKGGKRYTYEVYKKIVVKPSEVSVLNTQEKPSTATLITCDPPGTSTNRLIVVGQQISPDPNLNLAGPPTNSTETSAAILPSNAPSLWSKIFDILSR